MIALRRADALRTAYLLVAVALLPLALVTMPPFVDYPQHLARVWILLNLETSEAFQEFYRSNWAYQPNLSFDVVTLALARVFDIDTAGKIFVALGIAANVSGVIAVHRVTHGRASLFPLLVLFFCYNRILLGGIVSYLFTLGFAFLCFAAWMYLRERQSPLALCLAVGSLFALGLYFGHLTAFGVYALMIGGYELDGFFRNGAGRSILRRLIEVIVPALQFVAPILIFFAMSTTFGEPTSTRYGNIAQKLSAPLNLLYNYNLTFDILTFAVLTAIMLAGLWFGRIRFASRLMLPLILLTVAYIATPNVMFDSHGADRRLTIAVAQIAICAMEWQPERIRYARVFVVGLIALFLARMGLIVYEWQRSNALYAQYETAFAQMPVGSRLAVATAHPFAETTVHPPLTYVGALAVIRREAFLPTLFVNPAQQPMSFTPRYQDLAKQRPIEFYGPAMLEQLANRTEAARTGPFTPESLRGYDYLLIVREEAFPMKAPAFKTIASGEGFRLLEVPK